MSVTEGDHVVIKHPYCEMSEVLIINKIDLIEAMGTRLTKNDYDAKSINQT
jgi:Ni2+-binding GTPase involved in maturation of urease and hydrogenase